MKYPAFYVFLCILTLFLGCSKSCDKNTQSNAQTLRIGTNANFPPYESIDENGALVGFDIDMGRKLAKSLGVKPEFKEFDFDALILALKKEQIDVALAGISITESRKKEIALVHYEGDPLTKISFLFWKKVPSHIDNLKQLKAYSEDKGLSLSVQSGHFLEEFLSDEGLSLKPLAGPPEQILDIKYNKSLAAALDHTTAKSLAAQHKDIKILTLSLPKEKADFGYGIGIKKSRIKLLAKVKNTVSKLKQNGSIEQLRNKWLKDK